MTLTYFQLFYSFMPLFLGAIVTGLFLFNLQLNRKLHKQQRQIEGLNAELNVLLSCSRGISERLHTYQHQFRNITERQDQLEVGDSGSTDYKQAIALFNRGATEDEMLSTCDLSRGEINLIAHLQKAKQKKRQQAH